MNDRLASLRRWYARLLTAPYVDQELLRFVQDEMARLAREEHAGQAATPGPTQPAPLVLQP
jgi:hypothetical protein